MNKIPIETIIETFQKYLLHPNLYKVKRGNPIAKIKKKEGFMMMFNTMSKKILISFVLSGDSIYRNDFQKSSKANGKAKMVVELCQTFGVI